jgi:hypothetical protein
MHEVGSKENFPILYIETIPPTIEGRINMCKITFCLSAGIIVLMKLGGGK